MNIIRDLILLLWSVRIVANILSYVHLWFIKEYRWDRMLVHLHTRQGKLILFPSFRRPPISPKAISLTFSSVVIESIILIYLPLAVLLRFLLADLLLFPLTFLLVGIFRLPTLIYHQVKIRQAKKKLEAHKTMTVVGITGSFGKTSTKEYLATILEGKYKVLKTEASKNSAIGMAEVALAKLKPDHQIFIVEMGAYRRGEIRQMSEIVKPEIGIITAVNPQHQDLFGTIETTMKAKYELIQGLVGRRIAIFNADNAYVRELAGWASKNGFNVWSVGRESRKIAGAKQYFTITDLTGDLKGISFGLTYGGETVTVRVSVLGEHQALNISLAIAAAVACGLPVREAAKRAAFVKPFVKTMRPVPGINGSLFINDTFNNNPDAADAALEFLAKTRGRKILVFQPMIELGSFARSSHEEVGESAGRICDEIILTNHNFYEYFISGVRKARTKTKAQVLSATKAANYLKSKIKHGDTVLFKGKEAEQVLKQLIG